MKEKKKSSYLLIGSMLFGLFFGAGNLIFPVHMGQEAGQNVLVATLGFLLTGTGLPFLGILAIGLTESRNVLDLGSRVHRSYGYLVATLLYLTIGPFFALPRTGTVSFEVGFMPLISPDYQKLFLALFTILFFGAALFFALRPTRIMDWVGKFLNPLFLLFIAFLFLKAFLTPMGVASALPATGDYLTSPFSKGFLEGYQTMDALAALAFGSIVVDSIKQVGIKDPKEIAKSTAKSGIVAIALMCIIYGGLSWIGATSLGVLELSPNGGIALAQISRHYLGSFGSVFLAITITVACLKTAIGLITACGGAFHEMFPRVEYKVFAILFAIFACAVSNVGLTQIIALSMPMLMFLYPLATTLILLGITERLFHKRQIVYVATTIGALMVSIGDALRVMPDFIANTAVVQQILAVYERFVPFFEIGFGWMLPAGLGFLIGLLLSKLFPAKA